MRDLHLITRPHADAKTRAHAPAGHASTLPSRDSLVRLVDNLHEGACLVDRPPKITYWSASAEHLTGYGSADVLGRPCAHKLLRMQSVSGEALCKDLCPVAATMQDGQAREVQVHFRRRDGERVLSHLRIVPVLDEQGRAAGAVELFNDRAIHETARVRIAEVQKALSIDPVTALANRRYADLQLETRLHELARFGWPFGLLFFDIDHFKSFNDLHGHAVGDRVLAKVARAASACLRATDVLCRWGGDEFVAFVGHVNPEQLGRVAEKMRALVARSAVRVAESDLHVTLSVGAAQAAAAEPAEELVARADHLMYLSKALGGDRVSMGGPGDPRPDAKKALRKDGGKFMRVLLADDHEVVRQGLAALLKNAPDVRVVGEANNGAEAVEMAERLAPDVVIMDITMPVMDGVEATRHITQRCPAVRVIGLSALADGEPAQHMSEAGASMFVSKAASVHELLRAIRGASSRA